MPRSNLSDMDGESLTSDEESIAPSPRQPPLPLPVLADTPAQKTSVTPKSPTRTHRKQPSAANHNGATANQSKGIIRFRAAVRRVMQMHAVSAGIVKEPGIDVRRSATAKLYRHIHEACDIEVVDYNQTTADARSFNNHDFLQWLSSPEFERKPWSKVRWINISGVSWDIVSQLALKYPLHPLALEDLLSERRLARSKADYFAHHLFLRVVCHELMTEEEAAKNIIKGLKRSASPSRMDSQGTLTDEKYAPDKEHDSSKGLRRRRGRADDLEKTPSRANFRAPSETEAKPTFSHTKDHFAIEQLKEGDRVNVRLRSMCVFLTRDGTVISFNKAPNLDFTAPISLRLKTRGSGLRINPDASMLIHALLDLVVDRAMEVMDRYHEKILELEKITLLKPKMTTVRSLHVISGDLILHKRTMEPLKHLCYGIRRYDTDRCIALAEDADPSVDRSKVKGFMSHKAKIYLADVVDHVEHILSSMDMFSATAENLINYTFNLTSTATNEIMRIFTIVTIICLPLTLLTGYFGMNFARMDAVQLHSDAFFWIIAGPMLVAVVLATLWNDFVRGWHTIRKTMLISKAR